MNDYIDPRSPDERGREVVPTVDAAIERMLASLPHRRASAMLDARIGALIERRAQPIWKRFMPMAVAASFTLAIGFVAGNWMSQARLNGDGRFSEAPTLYSAPTDGTGLILQDSSVRPAALAAPRTVDLGDDGAVQAAESFWIRTDRFHDPNRGVTVERSYPESWTLVGVPAAD